MSDSANNIDCSEWVFGSKRGRAPLNAIVLKRLNSASQNRERKSNETNSVLSKSSLKKLDFFGRSKDYVNHERIDEECGEEEVFS
jgi:hypothetical protein